MKAWAYLILFCTFLGAPSVSLGALTFFSPPLEKLDSAELESIYAAALSRSSRDAAIPNAMDQVDGALAALGLADFEALRRHPHESVQWLRRAEASCDDWESDGFSRIAEAVRARAGYLCAIVRTELLANAGQWISWGRASRLADDLVVGQLGRLETDERWYAEGRIFQSLSPGLGQNLATSLMALSFLERLRPDLGSPVYWLARAHERRGNRERAEALLAKAWAMGDARARLEFGNESPRLLPRDVDGARFGWAPGIFLSPSNGVGLALRAFDDNLFDRDRSGAVELAGASRDYWRAAARYEDRASIPFATLGIDGSYQSAKEDFYGLGITSALANHAELRVARAEAQAWIRRELADALSLTIGWRETDTRVKGSAGGDFDTESLPDKQGIGLGGPFGEITLDTRDSRFDPHEGFLLSLRGDFPTRGLGSSRTYQSWHAEGHVYWEIFPGHRIALGLGVAAVQGEAPFAEYPRLGGTLGLPGMRWSRFQDRIVAAEVAEYRARLWGPVSVLLFGVAGTATPDRVLKSAQQVGFGTGLQYQASRYRAPLLRLEVGRFGGETVVQASAAALW